MKKTVNRLLSILLAIMLVLGATGTQAFADEVSEPEDATLYNVELTSEGIAQITDADGNPVTDSTRGTGGISGFKQATLSNNPDGVFVVTQSWGFGGMGITIKTSSSWNGYMSLDVITSDPSVIISGSSIYSNTETQFHNLMHYSPSYIIFKFSGIPSGQSVFVQIWVYG